MCASPPAATTQRRRCFRACLLWVEGWLAGQRGCKSESSWWNPDGQEPNLSPVCHYGSTSQIATDPAAPLISPRPQQRHTEPTHTYVRSEPARAAFWKPETVTETHMLNINRSGQCQEFIASICHSKAGSQKALASLTPQRLALASNVHRPCNYCRQAGLSDG